MSGKVIYKSVASDSDYPEESLTIIGRFKGRGRPVAILFMENQCCQDRPVMLYEDSGNYACDCACGGWCTNGLDTPEEAVAEYRYMNYRYIKEKEYIKKYGSDNFLEYASWNGMEYINTDPDIEWPEE